jgi:hypothetical protein
VAGPFRPDKQHPTWAILAALLCVAAAVRLAHVGSVVGFELSGVMAGMDRWLQMQIAVDFAGGDLSGGDHVIYESSPTYALLLGALYRLAGYNWQIPLFVQAILGALAPCFLWCAGSRLASRRVGLLAALLACFYGPAVFHEGLTTKFSLVPVSMSALLCAAAGAAGTRHRHRWAMAAGVAAAFLVSLRPNAVLILPIVVLWIVWAHRPAAAVLLLLSFGAGLVAVASPIALRRSLAADRGHAASLWGVHFYIGTVPSGSGGYVVVPGMRDDVFGHVEDGRSIAEEDMGRMLSPAEVSTYWFRRGLKNIKEHPLPYLALEARKLRRLLSPAEEDAFGDSYAIYAARSPALRYTTIGFGAVAPLALIGIFIAVVRRSSACWCAAIAAVYATSLLVFFVTGRYRLVLVPPLLICAAVALEELGKLSRAGHKLLLAGSFAVLCVGALTLLQATILDTAHLTALVGVALLAAQVEGERR